MTNSPLYFAVMRAGMAEERAVNPLCEEGIISDHCLTLADVCEHDAAKAIEFLKDYTPTP
jgi:hypothetical protein